MKVEIRRDYIDNLSNAYTKYWIVSLVHPDGGILITVWGNTLVETLNKFDVAVKKREKEDKQ